MTKLAWVTLPALTLLVSQGCGSSDAAPPAPAPDGSSADAGGHGRGSGGAAGHAGVGHDGGGGVPVADTGPVDSGPPPDTTPPTFDGATGAATLGESRTRITWKLATDPQPGSEQDEIAYRVYRASKSKGEDYSVTRRCGDPLADAGPIEQADAPCYVVAPAGATSIIVLDSIPAHQYWYVVRAVDKAGNESDNTNEVSAKNDDTTAPDFGGVTSVSIDSARSIKVGWNAGYDLGSSDPSLVFKIWVNEGSSPDTTTPPTMTTKPGQHSAIVKGLNPLTAYYVTVRASDPSGNTDTNTRVLSVTTPEGVAPTFDGVKLASAEGKTVRVFWPPATDNVTDSASIVYDVYESLTSHVYDYTKPSYTTKPGASSITINEPNAGTRYYFVVRARDSVGNEDGGFHEASTTTQGIPDITPPQFAGVETATSLTPTTLQLTWFAANETNVVYMVYVSTATPVPLTTPVLTTRALTATIAGLSPNTAYNVVAVAQDAAGNTSGNPATKSATTMAASTDTTRPTGTGTPAAAMLPSVVATQLQITWTAGTDDVDGTNVRYHLCVSTVQADCIGASFTSHLNATTVFGATSAVVKSLTPRTAYFVNVKAEDHGGNLETADHFVQGTTPTSWATNVSSILFDRCIACHDFNIHAAIFNIPGNLVDPNCTSAGDAFNACQLNLIDPGKPEKSIIYRKVNEFGLKTAPFKPSAPNTFNGLQEPRDTPDKLTGEEDDTLRDWITQGAVAN